MRTVALYAAVGSEIDPEPAARALLERGVALAFPRVVPGQQRLVFHRVLDLDALTPGSFAIPEPDAAAPIVPVEHIDLFVVPGLAFDPRGTRLGWGQGHYDMTLGDHRAALRVGFAFACQIIPRVPRGENDLPMNLLVTEAGPRRCTG